MYRLHFLDWRYQDAKRIFHRIDELENCKNPRAAVKQTVRVDHGKVSERNPPSGLARVCYEDDWFVKEGTLVVSVSREQFQWVKVNF